MLTRRDFGKLALAGLPAATVLGRVESIFGAIPQAKPNSLIEGVQIGTITYSFRSMPDQSAEATLKYVVESGISAIELMGGPVESFAGAPAGRSAAAVVRAGGGRAAGGRGSAPAAAPGAGGPWHPASGVACVLGRGPVSRARRLPVEAAVAVVGGGDDAREQQQAAQARSEPRLAEGLAHVGVHGRLQTAARDVQRRGRLDLRVEAAQSEHVRRGVRGHLQRRRGARLHAHDARTPQRSGSRGATQAHRRLRDEEEDLRRRITRTPRAA